MSSAAPQTNRSGSPIDQPSQSFAHDRMIVDDKDGALLLDRVFSLARQKCLSYSSMLNGSVQMTTVPPPGFF